MSEDLDGTTRLPAVVVVGNFGVGKSTLFQRLTRPANPRQGSAGLRLPDGTKLVDTCDMERFDNMSLTANFYRDAACVLLVADATNIRSVQSLHGWKDNAALYAPKAARILVMTKVESPDADEILLGSMESYQVALECCFSVAISSHTGQGITRLLDRIAEVCRMRRCHERRITRDSTVRLDQAARASAGSGRRSTCC